MLCSVSAFNRSLILMVKIQLFIKMTLHSSELFLWMQCKLGWSPDPLAQSPQAVHWSWSLVAPWGIELLGGVRQECQKRVGSSISFSFSYLITQWADSISGGGLESNNSSAVVNIFHVPSGHGLGLLCPAPSPSCRKQCAHGAVWKGESGDLIGEGDPCYSSWLSAAIVS